MKAQRGARPIKRKEYLDFYREIMKSPKLVSLDEYCSTFRNWITESSNKSIRGLDAFEFANFTNGTSQAFDHFILRHHSRRIVFFAGEFQYHAALTKNANIDYAVITSANEIRSGDALIMSCPFSDLGMMHLSTTSALSQCNLLDVPVLLDLAYWGISRNVSLFLDKYFCVEEVTCSLSKPFWVLETHRVGIRFTRKYIDGGVSMINEVGMSNDLSRFLGTEFMKHWSCDYAWHQEDEYQQVVASLNLAPCDTLIFALDNHDKYPEFNRGIVGSNRICISNYLSNTNENLYT